MTPDREHLELYVIPDDEPTRARRLSGRIAALCILVAVAICVGAYLWGGAQ